MDGTGRIRYTEFLAATIEAQGAISEERLAEAFDRLDCDDSGYISAENLAELLGQDFPPEEINSIITEADLTKDNRISYSEFLALWENKHEQDREAQLNLLGENSESRRSDFDMCSFRGSSCDLESFNSERESAEARASFVMEKHNSDSTRHVGFTDTVLEIPSNDGPQSVLSDDVVVENAPRSPPRMLQDSAVAR